MGLIRDVREGGPGFPGNLRFLGVLFLAVTGIMLPGPPVRAQNLGAEIQGIEKKLENPGLSGADRRAALTRLARLRELSGGIEAAARAWEEAAAAEPGKPDDESLLRGAWCLAAMGEWEKAAAPVRTILLAGRSGPSLHKARYLGALVEALGSADFSALKTLADDSGFAAEKPAIYYTLWKSLGPGGEGDRWKTRLLAEYPRSPEARIAAGDAGTISAAPTPLWLLFPGRSGFTALVPAVVPAVVPDAPSTGNPAAVPAAAPAAVTPQAAVPPETILLQTGLYGNRGNAEKQADRLRAAGFAPLITRRTVNGGEYWAAGVSSGPDMSRMILRLKDAGFEAFPVY